MTTNSKQALAAFSILSLIIGFVIGVVANDLPRVNFNSEVKLFEVLSFLLTLTIGTVYPFLIKKWIEDKRLIKSCLVDEVKGILSTSTRIKAIIQQAYTKGQLTQDCKDEINIIFNEIDLQISSFKEQLHVSFPAKADAIDRGLMDKMNSYWQFTTGGEMMSSKFNMSESFLRDHNSKFSLFEKHLKVLIHQIYEL